MFGVGYEITVVKVNFLSLHGFLSSLVSYLCGDLFLHLSTYKYIFNKKIVVLDSASQLESALVFVTTNI